MSRNQLDGTNNRSFTLPCDDIDIAAGITLDKFRGKQPMFIVKGVVEAGKISKYSINGIEFSVGSDTWIFGEFKIGAMAKIEGTMNIDNQRHARKIVVESQH